MTGRPFYLECTIKIVHFQPILMGFNTDVSAEMIMVDDHGQHYEVQLTVLFMLPILTSFFLISILKLSLH